MERLGIIKNSFFAIILLFVVSCVQDNTTLPPVTIQEQETQKPDTPIFNADTAFYFVEKQVLFGPRVPNSKAHQNCSQYLQNQLKRFGAKTYTQESKESRFDGEKLNMTNIIGSFYPEKARRIFLCAHWDSRFIADNDTQKTTDPIDGANDGASGVGVLLEIARQLLQRAPNIGVDIIFFDLEDQGKSGSGEVTSWCLGSQYWSRTPHISNYKANYGILLDMVGGPGAIFTQEGFSVEYAKDIVNKCWNQAVQSGYSDYFSFEKTPGVIDDHLPINQIMSIPTINIIEYDPGTENHFNKFWHTHGDNMNNISSATLEAVGQTVLSLIYSE